MSNTVVSIVLFLLPLFIKNNVEEAEIAGFITAVAPFIGPNAPKTGSVPAFRIGGVQFGPIPFAPVPPT